MKPEIECVESKLIYENRWMALREDQIRRADGSPGIYSVVEKPDFAVIAAIQDGYIHLVEQYRYPVGARYWELPQGSWESGVDDPRALAIAELREETGIVAQSMAHVGRLFLALPSTASKRPISPASMSSTIRIERAMCWATA